jgi:hypothetical protein
MWVSVGDRGNKYEQSTLICMYEDTIMKPIILYNYFVLTEKGN